MDSMVIYYASENMNGKQRYDYAMINFNDEMGQINTCPAKILGFIRYNLTTDIPTPHVVDNDDDSGLSDDNHTYAVVHAASDYVSLDDLQNKFVIPFQLGDVLNCLYIVKTEAIRCPLFVFNNYGAEGDDRLKKICTIPQRKWGRFFSNELSNI